MIVARGFARSILLLGLALSLGHAPGRAEDRGPVGPSRAGKAERGTFETRQLLTGELEAVHADKIIVPRTPTWQMPIRWILADGTPVTAGQSVVELDNSQYTGELEQKRLAVDEALNQLNQKQADLSIELADKEFAAEEARIKLEKARLQADVPPELLPERDYQEKVLELEKAEIAYQKALEEQEASRRAADAETEELKIALERAQFEVQTAEDAIASLTLRAPRDGLLVVAQNGEEGRKYQIGDNAFVGLAVAEIPDLSAMQVSAMLSDVDDGRIEVGMRAECVLDTYPERTYEGTVTDIAPVATEQGRDSLRRAFRVVIALDEADPERMVPGMSVRAEVIAEHGPDTLLVSRAAVEIGRNGARVRLANGEVVDVILGPCDRQQCVVLDGLEDGVLLTAVQ